MTTEPELLKLATAQVAKIRLQKLPVETLTGRDTGMYGDAVGDKATAIAQEELRGAIIHQNDRFFRRLCYPIFLVELSLSGEVFGHCVKFSEAPTVNEWKLIKAKLGTQQSRLIAATWGKEKHPLYRYSWQCIAAHDRRVAAAEDETLKPIDKMQELELYEAFRQYFDQSVFFTIWGALSTRVHLPEIWRLHRVPASRTQANEDAFAIVKYTYSCWATMLWSIPHWKPRKFCPAVDADTFEVPPFVVNKLREVQQVYATTPGKLLPSPKDVPIVQRWDFESRPRGDTNDMDAGRMVRSNDTRFF